MNGSYSWLVFGIRFECNSFGILGLNFGFGTFGRFDCFFNVNQKKAMESLESFFGTLGIIF